MSGLTTVGWASALAAISLLAAACGAPSATAPGQGSDAAPEARVLVLTADDGSFNTDRLVADGGYPLTIEFINSEGIPHNVTIWDGARETRVFHGEIVEGPTTVRYEVGELPVGVYRFECFVHASTMFGTLMVRE